VYKVVLYITKQLTVSGIGSRAGKNLGFKKNVYVEGFLRFLKVLKVY